MGVKRETGVNPVQSRCCMPLFISSNPCAELSRRGLTLFNADLTTETHRAEDMPLCWTKNQHGKAFEEKDKPEDLPQEYASTHRFEEKRSGFTFYSLCKGT